MSEGTTDGKKWFPTPFQNVPQTTGAIQGIWLAPNQEVEWIWTHGLNGSFVSGYTVRTKPLPKCFGEDEEQSDEKTKLG